MRQRPEQVAVIEQAMPWYTVWTREQRRRLVAENEGKRTRLRAGDWQGAVVEVQVMLFVPRKPWKVPLARGRQVQGGGADAKYGWRGPAKVELVVKVISAPQAVRQAMRV